MKRKGLTVNRSPLRKLFYDSLQYHTFPKKYSNKTLKMKSAHSITFKTLNRLVRFFHQPAGKFFRFVGNPVIITTQPMMNYISRTHIQISYLRGNNELTAINILDKSNKNEYLLIASIDIISAGLGTILGFKISFKNCYQIQNNKLMSFVNQDIIIHYLQDFSEHDRTFLDAVIIRNYLNNAKSKGTTIKEPNYADELLSSGYFRVVVIDGFPKKRSPLAITLTKHDILEPKTIMKRQNPNENNDQIRKDIKQTIHRAQHHYSVKNNEASYKHKITNEYETPRKYTFFFKDFI